MIVDARSVPPGSIIETEVCIIGGGAAGITSRGNLSMRRFASPSSRAAAWSWMRRPNNSTRPEYRRVVSGFDNSRLRFFGGTTNHWGGWCLPLDAIDFERRDDLPYHEWPFPNRVLIHGTVRPRKSAT